MSHHDFVCVISDWNRICLIAKFCFPPHAIIELFTMLLNKVIQFKVNAIITEILALSPYFQA